MKINNQYQEAEAIYPVTGLYIDPEGSAVEKSEMLLSEHRMDVYINDVLTMKLVCTPKDLPGLVLGRMVSEGMIHSSEEVEYLYICEHGTRARVQLGSEHCGLVNDNLSAEVMDTPTCCTDNKTIYSGFAVEKELQHLEPVKVRRSVFRELTVRIREGLVLLSFLRRIRIFLSGRTMPAERWTVIR